MRKCVCVAAGVPCACGTFSPGAGAEQTWIRAPTTMQVRTAPRVGSSTLTRPRMHARALRRPAAAAYMMSGPLKSCRWRGQTRR